MIHPDLSSLDPQTGRTEFDVQAIITRIQLGNDR